MQKINTFKKSVIGGGVLGFAVAAVLVFTAFAAEESDTPWAAPAIDEGNLRAYIELARSDIQTEKATIVAENLEFTDDEAFEFWPLHREYTLELNQLLDRRLNLLRKHVANFEHMTDKQAEQLADDVFDLEAKRLKLKRAWFKKFSKAVPAKKAAQFFQLENQLNAVLDLQLAAAMPLIK